MECQAYPGSNDISNRGVGAPPGGRNAKGECRLVSKIYGVGGLNKTTISVS